MPVGPIDQHEIVVAMPLRPVHEICIGRVSGHCLIGQAAIVRQYDAGGHDFFALCQAPYGAAPVHHQKRIAPGG